MITLTGKTTNYQVSNESATVKLSGQLTLSDNEDRIVSFNGSFNTIENVYIGNFYYSENENGRVSKNVSDVDITKLSDVESLLDETIVEIKQINDDNE